MEILSENLDRIDDSDFLTSTLLVKAYGHLPEKFLDLVYKPLKDAVKLAALSYKRRRMDG